MSQIVTCPNCGAKNRIDERANALQPVCGRCGQPLPTSPSRTYAAGGGDTSHPREVTDASFASDVLGVKGKPVLVDFWAPWCPPCRALTPTVEKIASESAGRYVVAKMNVDENPQVAGRMGIEGVPALFIFKDGQLVDRLIGLQPAEAIRAHLQAQI